MTQVRATSRARARELCGGVEREEPEEAVGLVPMVTLSVVGSDRNMDIPRRTSSGSPATPPPLGPASADAERWKAQRVVRVGGGDDGAALHAPIAVKYASSPVTLTLV